MKWLIVVVFAMSPQEYNNGMGMRDMYVFTKPVYSDLEKCQADILNPDIYPTFIEKLVLEYKKLKKIESVVCVEEQELKNAIEATPGTSI